MKGYIKAKTAIHYHNQESVWDQEIFKQDLKAAKKRVKNRKHCKHKWKPVCHGGTGCK